MAGTSLWRTLVLSHALGPFGPLVPASANWLLQCSSCVDQAYFGDQSLKSNVKDADLNVLLAQIKQVRLREFDHREDEFYNKFFSKRQLGIMTNEIQSVMPSAVALLPERRWTNAKGVSNVTKNVMMLRQSHIMFAAVGAVQLLGQKAEYWDATIDKLDNEMVTVIDEQNDNRRKREQMLEQIVRTVAKVEVLQHTLSKTEEGFVRLENDVDQFRMKQGEHNADLERGLELVRNQTNAQDEDILHFFNEFRAAVDREARADLVEKRKSSEANVEVELVRRSIEKLRWSEEQKTIHMRGEEQRHSEEHNSKLHQERVAHELAQKKAADLQLLQSQEESNMRQEAAKQAGEMELLKLKLESEEKRAEMGVQEAIERAKIEQEAKIRERRDNEDVHLRAMQAEQKEKRQQLLDAIHATAEIILNWIKSLYGSPQNLMQAIASIVVCLGGVYVAREMAILLREQLNKRMGRPSLVRSTNRRGFFQELGIGIRRLLRLAPPRGAEFNDVVLHPKLHQRVMRLAEATASAKKRKMPLQHAMFYGPPGTGKTMVAQRFAEYSGLEYAIMSGGDVAPLQEQAVTELHKLFKWVQRSKRGVLLFIDEADAFLTSRTNGVSMSEPLRNALTTMLYHTGTPSSQFMLVLATNRPSDLDSAVLDRMDEAVEFGLPDIDARTSMVDLYFNMYVAKPLGIVSSKPLPVKDSTSTTPKRVATCLPPSPSASRQRASDCGACIPPSPSGRHLGKPLLPEVPKEELVDKEALAETARRLHGFSGREIAKLFTSLQTHVLFSLGGGASKGAIKHVPRSMLYEVVDQKVIEHGRTADFLVNGYAYQNTEQSSTVPVTPQKATA